MPTHTALLSCVLVVFLLLSVVEVGFEVSAASAAEVGPHLPDVNGDGVVDMRDVAVCAYAYGSNPGDPRWNSAADLNHDGKVDGHDIALVAKDFGKNCRSYDFNELSDWNVSSGNWSIQNGTLEGSSNTEGLIYAGDVTWKDCTLTAKVKIAADSPSTEAALCVYLDQGDFYWAGLGCWGHRVSISRRVGSIWQELASSGDIASVDRDVWYILTVKASGGTIMLYLNGSLELSVNDSTFVRGSVGMRTWSSHVIIDYATVIGTLVTQGQSTHDVLYADGTKLRSPSGEEVILVGAQCNYDILRKDIWFTIDDIKKMKSYGAVVVELHILIFRFFMPQRGVIDQNFVDQLDKWVSWCEQQQMYYLISFGNFEYKTWGQEMPIWFLEGKYPQPWWMDKNAINQASIDFWDVDNPLQEDSRQAVLEGFRFIANRYKNSKYALFGLINEPFCTNHLVNSTNAKHLNIAYARFVERIVDAIRSTGAKQLIFVDKPYSSFYAGNFEPVNRDGIVWEDHLYLTAESGIDQWKTDLNKFVQRYVYTLNKPFYLGEYAPYPYSAYKNTLSAWRTILKEQVTFLKTLPVCGYQWHEWPYLEGEYYDYLYDYLTKEDSDYILTTIYG
jgi:hypothetical protein